MTPPPCRSCRGRPGTHRRLGLLLLLSAPGCSSASDDLTRFRKGSDLWYDTAPDTKGQLDSWQLFEPGDVVQRALKHISLVLVLAVLGLGSASRAYKIVPQQRIDDIRRATFEGFLPAFFLRHLWLCELNAELKEVAFWSAVTHTAWTTVVLVLLSHLPMTSSDKQLRGWSAVMSVGGACSFVYPMLAEASGFGDRAVACAVMWDICGNAWVGNVGIFFITSHFAPRAVDDFDGLSPSANANGALATAGGVRRARENDADEEGEMLLPPKELPPWVDPMQISSPSPASSSAEIGAIIRTLLRGEASTQEVLQERWKPAAEAWLVLVAALKQPIVIAQVLGLLLNFVGAPMPMLVDNLLWVLGLPYKLLLYYLAGYLGRYDLSMEEVRLLSACAAFRYAIAATIGVALYLLLPLDDPIMRCTVAVLALSPSATIAIHFVALHGFGEYFFRLTVTGCCASAVISTVVQHIMLSSFGST